MYTFLEHMQIKLLSKKKSKQIQSTTFKNSQTHENTKKPHKWLLHTITTTTTD